MIRVLLFFHKISATQTFLIVFMVFLCIICYYDKYWHMENVEVT